MKNGDPQEQAGYQNLRLHWLEHQAALQQKQAAMPQGKPPSESISLKDLPPGPAADLANKGGIKATPKDFAEQEAAEALAKHPAGGIVQ